MVMDLIIPLVEITLQQIDTPRDRIGKLVPASMVIMVLGWLISSVFRYLDLKELKGTKKYPFGLIKFILHVFVTLLVLYFVCWFLWSYYKPTNFSQ